MLNHTRTFEKLEAFGRYRTRRTDTALVAPNTPRLRLGVFGVTRAVSVLLVRYHQNIPWAKPSGYFVEIPLVTQGISDKYPSPSGLKSPRAISFIIPLFSQIS